ncbi:glycosyl transferase [Mycobacterium hodleri]|uniref:glycosyltransferase n=1 Tax=Mycolicibacterium hodleri TaxID=49897 RepID=UPI0021F36BA8|nr:nucleotide disphospho-sugar-binding domain-containing protein [Mycolicibacterium hodleri]MCV7136280.1 glycosyl transferase [Mycolicibacterium hodleri]
MRVAVVAGPDPGHAFPAIALCLKFLAAGDEPTLVTGAQWLDLAGERGVDAMLLAGLDPVEGDDDADSGAKLHRRAARMAVLNERGLADLDLDLVVSDVITSCGGMAAEMLRLPWVELNPHPLYRPSTGLPPLGSGLAPGVGVRGHLRDAVMRALTARSWRTGQRQRSAARVEIGLPASDPGPERRLIATLPALEVPRPDWPAEAVVVGPLHFEPTTTVLEVPDGTGPVIVVAPSTAVTGTQGLAELALETLIPGQTVPTGARVVVSRLAGRDASVPPWAVVGLGRQDALLSHADVVVGGGGHGLVAKALLAGVPMVLVPGGGDQWEISNRIVRQGSGRLLRPLTAGSLTAAVDDVLSSPRYRERAREAGESIADVADPVRVCHDALVRSR